ncbi:hypothetical protein BGX27_004993, partial [Mortierella sp. AM989]
QTHFSRNISELAERAREHNADWAFGDGSLILADIDDEGTSKTHDPISLFWILNSHLPAPKQMAFLPEGGFTDKFFTITEEAFLKALLRGRPQDLKAHLEEVFISLQAALEHSANHPGDLFYRLFFSKNLSYTRSLCLVNPDSNILSDHALFDDECANTLYSMHGRECIKSFIKLLLQGPIDQKCQ